jgi:putative ABC transport system permease protein
MLWYLAWKNVWRNRTRSLIVALAILFGLFGALFSSAIYRAMGYQRMQTAIANEVSNLQIHHPLFVENRELTDTLSALDSIRSVLDTMKGIRAYSIRLKIIGMASSAATGSGVLINGISPEMGKNTTWIYRCIRDSMGTWFGSNQRNFIIIGEKLANKLKLKLRSKIVLTFQDKDGNIGRGMYKIGGIYHTGNSSFDEMNVFVRYEELLPQAGFNTKTAHEIAVSLENDSINPRIVEQLKIIFPQTDVQGWKALIPDLGMMNDFMDQTIYIMMVIVLLALSFGIINTMLMAVLERTREIGMLLALGMSRFRIFLLIMLETIFLSLSGGLAGMAFSYGIISWFGHAGLDLHSVAKGMEDIGFSAVIYPYLNPDYYLTLTILVILTGIIASIMPARRAIRLNPVEAIRTV